MADNPNANEVQKNIELDPTKNWTKTPEQLEEEKKLREEKEEKEKEEKKKNLMNTLKDPKVIFGLFLLITQIIIVIILFQSCYTSKSLQKNQSALSKAVSDYITVDKLVAEQVVQNQSEIMSINEKINVCNEKLVKLSAEMEKIPNLTDAMTKINKLAIINRNRIYSILMKEDPIIKNVFSEEKIDNEEIQSQTEKLMIEMTKAIELKYSLDSKDSKKEEKEIVEKPSSVEDDQKVEEMPSVVKEEVKINNEQVEKPKKKRDFFLFVKPWKWFGRSGEK